ncbi:MAG: isoprenyl transferase [Bryobacteraceae bacterium]
MKEQSDMRALLEILPHCGRERELALSLDPARIPAHVGIIMDGNGRWARRRSLPRAAGHRAGVEPVRMAVDTCARLGVSSLTLYAFSAENWKRPHSEVETLWRLLRYYLNRELSRLVENNVRFRTIGRVHALPPDVRRQLEDATRTTAGNSGLILNLAINYSGRAEIVDAVNALIEEARRNGTLESLSVDEEALAAHLGTAGQPDVDLLIRTSGEMRISNFLLWQIAYAELYVTPTLWPDFDRLALLEAIAAYQKRDRRFGGIHPQGATPLHEPSLIGSPGLTAR